MSLWHALEHEKLHLVIPGKAAGRNPESKNKKMDSGFRRNDGLGDAPGFCRYAVHPYVFCDCPRSHHSKPAIIATSKTGVA
jgi:hypothetical protein